MENLSEFSQKIEERLVLEENGNATHQNELGRQNDMRKVRLEIFDGKSKQLMNEIIRPRVEKVVGHFENATISSLDSSNTQCVYRFDSRPRFPASTTLSFTITQDPEMERLRIEYGLKILPIFMNYEREGTISFHLRAVDDLQCTAWVETKLLSFLDVYLQLGHIAQYQQENLVIDPVCGVQINKAFAIAEKTSTDRKHFFCSTECRDSFAMKHAK